MLIETILNSKNYSAEIFGLAKLMSLVYLLRNEQLYIQNFMLITNTQIMVKKYIIIKYTIIYYFIR